VFHAKAVAKNDLLFDTPEVGLLNKSFRLAPALCATKFIPIIAMDLVTLCCAT